MNKRIQRFRSGKVGKQVSAMGGILLALAAMIIALYFATPYFVTGTNLTNLLRQITTNALLAFGMTYCLISGEIDLSVGSTAAFGGVLIVTCLMKGMNLALALPLTLLVGLAIGVINGVVVCYTGMPAFIVTLAMQSIVRGLAYIISGNGRVKTTNTALFDLGNGTVGPIPIPTILVIACAVVLGVVLSRTVFGKHVYATGGNRSAAIYSGVNDKLVRIIVFTISSLLATMAGIIIASRVNSGQASVGDGYEGDAIAAAVLGGTSFTGGRGTVVGTIIGVFVIGILNNGLNLLEVSYYWQLVCKGLIILFAVYIDTVKRTRKQ